MKAIRTLLVATDFSPASRPAFQRALEMAAAGGAALWIAHVTEPPIPISPEGYVMPLYYDDVVASVRADAQKRLRALVSRANKAGVRTKSLILEGRPARRLESRRPAPSGGRHGAGYPWTYGSRDGCSSAASPRESSRRRPARF